MDGSAVLRTAEAETGLSMSYGAVRALSEVLVAPLSDADATVQSMPDASPAKWHLAHTTWFFETFLLRDRLEGYRLFDRRWPFLFNSYYEAEGPRHARAARGVLSRPSLEEVLAYRAHVDAAMEQAFDRPELAGLIELGFAHEQQHQELLLTDIKHALWCNPLGPAYAEIDTALRPRAGGDLGPSGRTFDNSARGPRLRGGAEKFRGRADAFCGDADAFPGGWHDHPGGIASVGHEGHGFAFDNEGPRHRVLLEPFALAGRLVSNEEWDTFIADAGYHTASLWLSDGWSWVRQEQVEAPLYWHGDEQFTLAGWQQRDPQAPVTHISYYEADAFATWAGYRLPTEFEWEAIAAGDDPAAGGQLDGMPAAGPAGSPGLFGDCWQWTRSGYLPYPRFRPAAGAVGEYNGKFMSGQFVLKGASCATPRGHSRASYRNFFYPHQRWQFTGLRLAKDL
jgi:formylglycine-generating enzyme required for sulfatase activity